MSSIVFSRPMPSITRRFGGLGLGWRSSNISSSCTADSVTASSPGEGQGSTFTLTLPTVRGLQVARCHTRRRACGFRPTIPWKASGCSSWKTKRTAASFCRGCSSGMARWSRRSARRRKRCCSCRRRSADILVSDIGLPGTDGYDLIQQIRTTLPDCARMPAIAVTAYARSEDRTRALRAGFQSHLVKPIEPGRTRRDDRQLPQCDRHAAQPALKSALFPVPHSRSRHPGRLTDR